MDRFTRWLTQRLGDLRFRGAWLLTIFAVGAALAVSCQPAFAQQQATPPASAPLQGFAPPPGDSALAAFGELFGNLGGLNFFPGEADAGIGQMFLVFNTAVVSVAALFFLWNVMTSTIQAAHDGEFLGRRYHSFWMPFRTIFGVFSLMPVFVGWSFAQIFMAWAIWAGTGIANGVHSTSREVIEAETRQYAALPERPDFFKITADIYRLGDELIRQKQQQRLDVNDGVTASVAPYVGLHLDLFQTRDERTGTVWIVAGANLPDGAQVQGYTNSNIGAVPVTFTRPPAEYTQSRELQDAHELLVRQEVNRIVERVRADAQYLSTLDPLGDEFQRQWPYYQTTQNAMAAGATARYVQGMAEAQKQVAALDIDKTRGEAFSTQYGWIGAGLGIVDGASMSMESAGTATGSSFTRGDAPKAEVDLGGGPGFGTLYRQNFDQMWSDIKATYSKSWDQIGSGVGGTAAGVGNAAVATVALLLTPAAAALPSSVGIESTGDTVGDVEKLLAPLNQRMRQIVNELAVAVLQMLQVAANPLAALQHMGIGILNVLQLTFFSLMAVAGVALGASLLSFGGAASIFVGLMLFLTPALIAIGVFGIKLAVLLPFMPVILWIGAVLNYFVIAIESMFGAQLWALAHLDPDGEGMGQRTTHGYVFLLNLLFRPAMMVICLALGYKLLSIMAGIGIEALTGPLIKMVAADGENWILPLSMLLGVIWLFISLMEVLIHTSFSIVNVVPSQVIAWIGGTFGSSVGVDMDARVQQQSAGSAAAAGAVAGGTAAAASGLLRGGAGRPPKPKQPPPDDPRQPPGGSGGGGDDFGRYGGDLDRPPPVYSRAAAAGSPPAAPPAETPPPPAQSGIQYRLSGLARAQYRSPR